MAGDIRIGMSGWRYEPWRRGFYPRGLAQTQELTYASRRLNSIELNGTFYSLQRPSSYRAWYEQTPDDFVFAVKGGQFITHIRRLREIEKPLGVFFAQGILLLKEKLGPILWQFPPNFQYDHERMRAFFELLPRDTVSAAQYAAKNGTSLARDRRWTKTDAHRPVQHAVEIRHPSFLTDDFVRLLRRHKIALVVADSDQRFQYTEDITADFVYIRLHGDEELYSSGYTEAALDRWAARIKQWQKGGEPADARRIGAKASRRPSRDVYVYFDNAVKVRSPFDAMALSQRLGVKIKPPTIKSGKVVI